MRYAGLRREDLDIGTDAVEGAVCNFVAMHLDGPGMRWGCDRAKLILRLRCILLNGRCDAFVCSLATRSIELAAGPHQPRTHGAKSQQSRQAV